MVGTTTNPCEPVIEFDPDDIEPIPATAASTYTKLAEAYGRDYYAAVADDAAKRSFDPEARLLDAGTGPGLLPVVMAERISTVQIDAFDYTQRLVEISQERARRHGVTDRVSLLTADIYALPFPEATYSFITCTGVLHGLREPDVALRELYRVLEPGGSVWAFDPAVLDIDESVETLLNDHEQAVLEAYRASDGTAAALEPDAAERLVAASPFERGEVTEGDDGDSRLYLTKVASGVV